MRKVRILEEPRGEVYRALLRFTLEHCDGLLLVEPDRGLSAEGHAVLERLSPYQAGRGRTMAWPGHTSTHGASTSRYYTWNAECCAVVEASADHLGAWLPPALPEGLFVTHSETPWLVGHPRTGAHYLELSDAALAALKEAVPGLVLEE